MLFFYREVIKREIGTLEDVVRAKRPERVPVVFSQEEARAVLNHLSGVSGLMGRLLYRSGLRLMECARLRVKDIDFNYRQVIVRENTFLPINCFNRFPGEDLFILNL